MNKKIPCTLIRDMMPLYLDSLTSGETDQLIREHMAECEDCQNYHQLLSQDMKTEKLEKEQLQKREIDYMKKIHVYQKRNLTLGAVISFLLGFLLPIALIGGSVVLNHQGVIPDYYLARLQIAWHILLLRMFLYGLFICGIYLLICFCMKRKKAR